MIGAVQHTIAMRWRCQTPVRGGKVRPDVPAIHGEPARAFVCWVASHSGERQECAVPAAARIDTVSMN